MRVLGLHAVRYDHRDAGLSTHFTGRKKAYEFTDRDLLDTAVRPEDTGMTRDIIRLTEARSLPLDDEWVRQTATEALRRHARDRHSRSRQLAAGYTAKLPDGGIAGITQPVLVISGDEDPLIKPTRRRCGAGG